MRFAIMSTLIDPHYRLPHDRLLDTLREQTILADELGFETVWLGEHHFGPHGMGNNPNAVLVGADLAARTKRIRIGQLANIAVWWHPIRLAEDIAVLDNLTKGRTEVGLGRGPTKVLNSIPTPTPARPRRIARYSGKPSRS